jgi:LAO/AO transport system kinase
VMAAIDDHFAWMEASGTLRDRRVRRAVDEIEAIAIRALRIRIGDLRHGQGVDELAAQVVDGSSDPYAAADQVVEALT